MKKFIYIMFTFTILVSVNKIFAQKTQMKIGTQEVANGIGEVCLIHKDKQFDLITIERRKLMVGEIIEIDNQKPVRLLMGDSAVIYSQHFYQNSWSLPKIENWRKDALRSSNRNESLISNNFSKKNNRELTGYILTEDTLGMVKKAVISIIDEKGRVEAICNSDTNGKYSLKIPPGIYHYEVKSDNCLPYFDSLIVTSDKMVTEKYILLPRIKVGNRVVLKNITFEFNKAILKSESWPELDALTNFLKENKGMEIELSGHTDNKGSAAYNQKLSEKRAKAVVDYLVQNGIDRSRLEFTGYGFAQPIANNNTDEGRQENRRTEFEVTKFVITEPLTSLYSKTGK